jgi:hypothetical protein
MKTFLIIYAIGFLVHLGTQILKLDYGLGYGAIKQFEKKYKINGKVIWFGIIPLIWPLLLAFDIFLIAHILNSKTREKTIDYLDECIEWDEKKDQEL